jgi:hypothetical protein
MSDITDLAQKALELSEKATPAPWTGDRYDGTVKYHMTGPDPVSHLVLVVDHKNGEFGFVGDNGDNDEAFVMFARTALPQLARALIEQERALSSAIEAHAAASEEIERLQKLVKQNANDFALAMGDQRRENMLLRAEVGDLKREREDLTRELSDSRTDAASSRAAHAAALEAEGALRTRVEAVTDTLRCLVPFILEDGIPEGYWTPEFKTVMDKARDILGGY